MRSVEKSSSARQLLALNMLLVAVALVTLTGCGVSGSTAGFLGSHALLGSVRGGNQPVSGSSIQLYAAGISGVGSAAQPLLSDPVLSDSDGKFFIPVSFGCPSPSSQIYVVARGGTPGSLREPTTPRSRSRRCLALVVVSLLLIPSWSTK